MLMYQRLAGDRRPRELVERSNLMYRVRGPEPPLSRAVRRSTSASRRKENRCRSAASWAGRSTSAKAAGIATASSCGRSRTNRDRWGPVSRDRGVSERLQRPVMFGTRRVGPDLSREGGRPANDWHAVHFFRADAGLDRLADARLSLVLRRATRQAEQARPGAHHLRPMARLVAGKLSRTTKTIDTISELGGEAPMMTEIRKPHATPLVLAVVLAAGRACPGAQPVRLRHKVRGVHARVSRRRRRAPSPSARS